MDDKNAIVNNARLIRELFRKGMIKSFPMVYYDLDSQKNYEKKNIILKKILNNEKLSEKELSDKNVFELLPDRQDKKTKRPSENGGWYNYMKNTWNKNPVQVRHLHNVIVKLNKKSYDHLFTTKRKSRPINEV